MATLFQENIYITNTSPHVDAKYGPYPSVEDAWDFIGPDGDDIACIGLTVGIQPTPDDPVVEYWFKDACEDVSDLVLKEPDLSRFVEDANYVHTDNNFTDEEKQKLEDLENYDDTQIVNSLDSKVDKVVGKQLSTEDYTTADMEKLRNMQPGGQENVIETIRVNDQPLTPDEYKAVDITVPTNTSDLTNDSGFIDNTVDDLVNYYDKTEIDSKVASVYKYKGSVNAYSDLPSTGQVIGDVYNIATADKTHHIKAGDNVAWNGTEWDVLAGEIDLTDYYTSSEVDSLLDEKISEPASDGTNGQVLTTDGNGGRSWTSIPAGVESLDDLSDVGITTPTEGQILKYDATNDEWINANPDTISLDLEDLNNVSTTTPTDGQILKYDATNDEWVNADLDIPVSDLGDLGDVDIDSTSIADGQIIKYNATSGKWENANVDVSTSNLEDLGNVNVTTPTEGDIIIYDSTNSEWVNVPNTDVGQIIQVSTLPTASIDELDKIYQYIGATTSTLTNGYFYKCVSDGEDPATYSWENIQVQEGTSGSQTLSGLDDVTITNPSNNQILKYDAVNEVWVNSTGGTGQTIQVEELPTASSTEEGNIYQYIGETDENYTNGYFYKCVETETAGEYTWLNIHVDNVLDSQTIKDVDNIPVSQQIENIFYRTDNEDVWVTIDETMTLLEMAESIANNLHGNISYVSDTSVSVQPLTGYKWYTRSYQNKQSVEFISFHIINDTKEMRYHKGSGYNSYSIVGSKNLWFAVKNGDFKYYAGNKTEETVDRMAKYDDLPPEIWHGTREEWDALSTSEKIVYQYAVFTDDVSGEGSSSGGGIWGTIAGTLSNQTDLQNALNNKLDVSKIKDAESLVAGDVYDVTYINTAISNIQTTIGDIQTILDNI